MNADLPHFNETMIAELKTIMADDFELLVTTFINDSQTRCRELNSIVANYSGAEFGRACHSLKGSASNIGALRLAELCSQGECKDAEQEPGNAAGLLQEIAAELTLVADILQDQVKI